MHTSNQHSLAQGGVTQERSPGTGNLAEGGLVQGTLR